MGVPGRLHGKSIAPHSAKKIRCPSCHKNIYTFNFMVKKKNETVRVCPFCSYEFEKFRTLSVAQHIWTTTIALVISRLISNSIEATKKNSEAESRFQRAEEVLNGYEILASPDGKPKLAVSDSTIVGMMLDKKMNADAKVYMFLILSIVAHLIFVLFAKSVVNYGVVLLTIFVAGSLYANRQLLIYRVRKGYYGTNEDEAREIIQFILEHADNTDFTDGDGTKKLVPDPEIELQEEFVPEGGLLA